MTHTRLRIIAGGQDATHIPAFERYVGIDYSGAEVVTAGLKGLRVYMGDHHNLPTEVLPTGSSKYWSRKSLAHWLEELLAEDKPTLVGIDHAFSFPMRYFIFHALEPAWPEFLDDFCAHWPTDEDHCYVDFVRDGLRGNGEERSGDARWKRLTEERTRAKSVFHFDVPGSVAKSTHAGLPWLRFLRKQLGPKIHFWPFDGWDIPAGKSALAEIYPSLWSKNYPREDRTPDQHDAFVTASWLRQADLDGNLQEFLHPTLSFQDEAVAQVEGWILGVL